jgi:hypothetical protein
LNGLNVYTRWNIFQYFLKSLSLATVPFSSSHSIRGNLSLGASSIKQKNDAAATLLPPNFLQIYHRYLPNPMSGTFFNINFFNLCILLFVGGGRKQKTLLFLLLYSPWILYYLHLFWRALLPFVELAQMHFRSNYFSKCNIATFFYCCYHLQYS